MRWGYVEIYSNNSKTWSAGQAQLTVAPNSGSFEGIKIVGNEDQAADYLRIQSGSGDVLNITHNGSVSGSAQSTGSFGSLRIDDMSVSNIGLVSGSFSTRVSALKTDSGSFSTRTSTLEAASGSFSTRVSALKTDSGSFSTRTSTLEAGTFGGNVNIAGDLTVNGDTTTIATTNILVQDAFGFFATGSAGTNVDAGIIVQSGSYVDSGSAMYHDISKERWSVGKGIGSTATSVADSEWNGFVATVYTGSASPVGAAPKYGVGEIHVDGDGEIYIYS
jgi:hypothetical protein